LLTGEISETAGLDTDASKDADGRRALRTLAGPSVDGRRQSTGRARR
jgi:hypothetical protein